MRLTELKLLGLPRFRKMLLSRADMRARQNLPVALRRRIAAGSSFYCPVCESSIASFRDFGHIPAVWCPVCLSMDRHRLVWYFLRHRTNLFDGKAKRMLHVAAEPSFEPRLRKVPGLDYLTADLMDTKAMVRMDITDIQFPDASFHVVYCSHVLEHVPDDRKAMREFRRVLKPDGWAALMVPVTVDRTIEDPNCTDPAERERRFGQHDHFRTYGPDFADRLTESGFQVALVRARNLMSPEEQRRFSIPDGEIVFFCRPQ